MSLYSFFILLLILLVLLHHSYTGNLLKVQCLLYPPPERPDIQAKVFWGPSGVGKTRRAWEEAKALGPVYIKTGTHKWWDGYRGEKFVIIDEFDGMIRLTNLLTWLDRYPCRVEYKGGSSPLLATHFWVTSNLPLEEWFPDAKPDQVAALRRRVKVTHMLATLPPSC